MISEVCAANGSSTAVAEIRRQRHVALVDGLPAGDRRAVEHDAFGQQVLVDRRDVVREVMPLAQRIGEAEVDVFDVLFFDQIERSS